MLKLHLPARVKRIDYRNFQYRPQEAENQYYLTRWVELYLPQNRFTRKRDQTNSLCFLNADVQRTVIERERNSNTTTTCRQDSTLFYVKFEGLPPRIPSSARSHASGFFRRPAVRRRSASATPPLRGLGSSRSKFECRGKERRSNFIRAAPRRHPLDLGAEPSRWASPM